MKQSLTKVPDIPIENTIRVVRNQKVILDSDLAKLYGVENRALIQAVKRNSKRFPKDFLFQLTKPEFQALRSQIVISKGRGGQEIFAVCLYGAWCHQRKLILLCDVSASLRLGGETYPDDKAPRRRRGAEVA